MRVYWLLDVYELEYWESDWLMRIYRFIPPDSKSYRETIYFVNQADPFRKKENSSSTVEYD